VPEILAAVGRCREGEGSALVTPLRVIAGDLCSCLSDLFRDDEFRVALDDAFDRWVVVARDQQEVVALADDTFIYRWRNLDCGETGDPSAFAVKRQWCLNSVLLGAPLYLIVHTAKDLLVARRSLRKIHLRMFADRSRNASVVALVAGRP